MLKSVTAKMRSPATAKQWCLSFHSCVECRVLLVGPRRNALRRRLESGALSPSTTSRGNGNVAPVRPGWPTPQASAGADVHAPQRRCGRRNPSSSNLQPPARRSSIHASPRAVRSASRASHRHMRKPRIQAGRTQSFARSNVCLEQSQLARKLLHEPVIPTLLMFPGAASHSVR